LNRGRNGNGQRGLALVLVLWFITLISILALGFSRATRSDVDITRNLLQASRARHLAEAAIEQGIYRLLQPQQGGFTGLVRGEPVRFSLDGARLGYRIQDENGKININRAPPKTIKALLEALGVEEPIPITDAIMDWRDSDDLRRPRGAEEIDYREAGRPVLPANRRFQNIAELQQVMGVSAELYRRLTPFITVSSFGNRVNRELAPREVLMALPGISGSQVEAMIETRNRLPGDPPRSARPARTGVSSRIPGRFGPVYTIRGEALLPSGARAAWRRTVWIPGKAGDALYYTLDSGPDDSPGKTLE